MYNNEARVHPIVLSGGAGTRLWPLSRRAYPKQFLQNFDRDSLLQQTCKRLKSPVYAPLSVIGLEDHRFIIAHQLKEAGVQPSHIILEPEGRNTGPAALCSVLVAAQADLDSLMLLLPSDHLIADIDDFTHSVELGRALAHEGRIITFGVKPTSPQSDFGYIEMASGEDWPRPVMRFVEKPSREKTQVFVDSGRFLWNAGIFLFSATTLISAFESFAPGILAACKKAVRGARRDLDFLRLDKEAYDNCTSISLDHAIMEKSDNISCVPLNTAWSDLGSWTAVWESREKDTSGNVIFGDVLLEDTSDSFVYSDAACVSLVNVENICVVVTKDAVLVANKDHVQKVNKVVERLAAQGREVALKHLRVHRPWGWYEGLSVGHRFQVKCIRVEPGQTLSLQSHYHRAEHWIVVTGTIKITVKDKVELRTENESAYIPIGARHRLENPGKVPAMLIEVQSGSYLGEDDIVRFEDVYNRI